jgi:hypothetical protein
MAVAFIILLPAVSPIPGSKAPAEYATLIPALMVRRKPRLECSRKECLFGIPRNTEFYMEVILIPRSSRKNYQLLKFRGISQNSLFAEFHTFSAESDCISKKVDEKKL